MSILFFDRLLVLDEVDKEIKTKAKTAEEREELWRLVDEIIHHKIMGCVLDKLPEKSRPEFLEKFQKAPHDEGLFKFLTEKVGEDIEEFLKTEIAKLKSEILHEIKGK
ncbi:hypothetical protein COY30_00645 [Candidatus Woesebacteria bacterium CG_4_10_14_0_2_um_filter_44_9]|uniref:Uncharacterized protein n=1 Tax=Candidatus Woesebacteria bacterium CG_4_10_14_0_2_um_filter_44_9 TaxID=1975055 RepID=A0A2M7TIE3_9BACT|nr:MAG: hypothetical protein COY30_00645 [Candidatus Woesebacteria bacterium CG_4_10_14_0_2_um_filter_44_9]